MGFTVRKRTKGKDQWINGSLSGRGSHVSVSTKFGKNVTVNTSSRGTRYTINLGNGIRYTGSSSSSRRKTKEPESINQEQSEVKPFNYRRFYFWVGLILLFFFICYINE